MSAAAEVGKLRLGQGPDVRAVEPQLPSARAGQRAERSGKVDLPEPDRPTIDTSSPIGNSRLAPRTAWYPGAAPYLLVSDFADRITSAHFRLN